MMRWIIKGLSGVLWLVARSFHQALQNPQIAQTHVQQEIFNRFKQSDYGKQLGIQSIDDWQQIPIVTYDDLRPWIDRDAQTAKLTPEPILFHERTSGSRGAAKWIPHTKSLRRSFSQMFCVWVHDLLTHGPRFTTGKVYFCVSPRLKGADEGGIQDDSDYLEGWLSKLLSPFLVTLPNARSLYEPDEFKWQLCLRLLQEEKLEIISVWSPSFLKVMLDFIVDRRFDLQTAVQGQISPVRSAILSSPEINWQKLWPQLKLISCWDGGNAAEQANYLRSQFPQVLIQGKGLLATEAPMTVPLIAAQGFVPVLDEVFFEFETSAGAMLRLHELAIGDEYQIIISQKGGLYRYRMGDRVKVTHFYQQTPCLEFLGREVGISDLVGEKLNQDFVRDVLQQLDLRGAFCQTLIPLSNPAHYVLILDQASVAPESLGKALDRRLCQSPQYQYARSLRQLQPAKVIIDPNAIEKLTHLRMRSGARWGDVKPDALLTTPIESLALASVFPDRG
jgi:hypothetical protein